MDLRNGKLIEWTETAGKKRGILAYKTDTEYCMDCQTWTTDRNGYVYVHPMRILFKHAELERLNPQEVSI